MRRESNVPNHASMRAPPAKFQDTTHKSNMEDTFQDAFRSRQSLSSVPAQTPVHSNSRASQGMLVESQRALFQKPAQFQESERAHKQQFEQQEVDRRKRYERQAQGRRHTYEAELQKLKANLDGAYAMLGVTPQCSQRTVAQRYRRAALRYHPDRQTNKSAAEKRNAASMFEQTTKAYLLILEKLKEEEGNQSFQQLKQHSRQELKSQMPQGTVKPNGQKFDLERFNQIYSENKLAEPSDEGYGQWLESDGDASGEYSIGSNASVFSDKFNLNVFNSEFDQQKDHDPNVQQQLIVREEGPTATYGYGNQAGQLGDDVAEDYSSGVSGVSSACGGSGQLAYTDLKQAHSSRLIHASRVSLDGHARSVDDLESQREKVSYQLSPEDAEVQGRLRAKREADERQRMDNVYHRDQLIGEHHARVNQLMLKKN
jgi:DnaJ-domain-containing protein 1